MALNTSDKEIIEMRRLQVARLRLRGMTQREIVEQLPRQDPPIVNPETEEPYSLGTINGDVKALARQWQREAKGKTERHKGRVLAEIQEVKRAAWERIVYDLTGGSHDSPDLDKVLKGLKQESEILGLNAPEKHEHTGKDGKDLLPAPAIPIEELMKLEPGELEKMHRDAIAQSSGSQS